MNIFDKIKQKFTGKKEPHPPKAEGITIDEHPIKPGPAKIRWLFRGFRYPPIKRVYRKRPRVTRFDDNRNQLSLSHRQARQFDIHRSMREANEIRRSHRERQLEERGVVIPRIEARH